MIEPKRCNNLRYRIWFRDMIDGNCPVYHLGQFTEDGARVKVKELQDNLDNQNKRAGEYYSFRLIDPEHACLDCTEPSGSEALDILKALYKDRNSNHAWKALSEIVKKYDLEFWENEK